MALARARGSGTTNNDENDGGSAVAAVIVAEPGNGVLATEPGIQYYEHKGLPYCRKDYLLTPEGRSTCAGCMKRLVKGAEALEACGKIWHLCGGRSDGESCFRCQRCSNVFKDDDPFFEFDDEPYCDKCFEVLIQACPTCGEVVAADGIFALGRNWHTKCFCCCACSSPFEGLEFFVRDAGDGRGPQPYCERDYLENFVPRCAGCGEYVKENAIEACGKSWHAECFGCAACLEEHERIRSSPSALQIAAEGASKDTMEELKLSFVKGDSYYERDGIPLCERHFFQRHGDICHKCNEVIKDGTVVNAMGHRWHPDCFACTKCDKPFPSLRFFREEGRPYCEGCYMDEFCERCAGCGEAVLNEIKILALGSVWHARCLVCSEPGCSTCLVPDDHDLHVLPATGAGDGPAQEDECGGENEAAAGFNVFKGLDGKPYCETHYLEQSSPKCGCCGKAVIGKSVMALDRVFHPECFICLTCGKALIGERVANRNGMPHCLSCILPKCAGCGKSIDGKVASAMGKTWHQECLCCNVCKVPFTVGAKARTVGEVMVCQEHFETIFCRRCTYCWKPMVPGDGRSVLTVPLPWYKDSKWHKECLRCVVQNCDHIFEGGKGIMLRDGFPVCRRHAKTSVVLDDSSLAWMEERKDDIEKINATRAKALANDSTKGRVRDVATSSVDNSAADTTTQMAAVAAAGIAGVAQAGSDRKERGKYLGRGEEGADEEEEEGQQGSEGNQEKEREQEEGREEELEDGHIIGNQDEEDDSDSSSGNESEDDEEESEADTDLESNSSSEDDEELPSGWTSHWDENSGELYYYHATSGKTQWERPS